MDGSVGGRVQRKKEDKLLFCWSTWGTGFVGGSNVLQALNGEVVDYHSIQSPLTMALRFGMVLCSPYHQKEDFIVQKEKLPGDS